MTSKYFVIPEGKVVLKWIKQNETKNKTKQKTEGPALPHRRKPKTNWLVWLGC